VVDDSGERAELGLTTTRDGTAAVIAVAGELDAYSAPSLEALAANLVSDGCNRLTLDLSGTTFIDSSALRTLLSLHTELGKGEGGGLTLQAPSDSVTRLLEITRLTEHFTVA